MFRRRKAAQDLVWDGSQNKENKTLTANNKHDNLLRTPTIETIRTKHNGQDTDSTSLSPLPVKHIDDLLPYPIPSDKSELEYALETRSDSSTIEYLLQKSKRARISAFHLEGFVLDLERAVVLEHILPYIEKLDCRPASYTRYGLFHLLRCLQTNHSISEIKLLHLPSRLVASNKCLQDELQAVLQMNDTLVRVRISMHQDRMLEPGVFHHELSLRAGNDNACFRAIYNAFLSSSKSQHVDSLELVDFHVQGHAFSNFLASPKMSKDLKFRNFRIAGPVEESCYYDYYTKSPITNLTMTGCSIAPECSKQVLEAVSQLPKLRYLTWCAWEHIRRPFGSHYERIDMTSAVLEMLRRDVIQSITSMTSSVHIPTICDALATNRSLQTFRLGFNEFPKEDEMLLGEVLRKHNTQLGEIARASSYQVRYYCNLNRYGRGQARDSKTTKREFVGLLWVANESHGLATDLCKLNVLHGLLQEMPHVWCR